MFVDQANITIRAGDGGNGIVSFHREKYVNAGGPDGGDGGKGGDVIFLADDNLSTLVNFRYKRKYVAPSGQDGGAKNCSGKSAEDLIIRVPKGTLVRDRATGRLIADISASTPYIIAKGGRGGAGNQHFATSTRQAPRFAKPGIPGEQFDLSLELKLLADVGLLGFPNVGKSTFISVVSAAKPKIANYHFTTLSPVLGVVRIDDEQSFIMADIPGLIEGASDGVGLGHDFLRHVDRCRLLLHVVDVSGIEGRDPIEDFHAINRELQHFSPALSSRPQIVVGNKSDLASFEQIERFRSFVTEQGFVFFSLSAVTHQGVKPLLLEVARQLSALPPIQQYEPEPLSLEELQEQQKKKDHFTITVEDEIFYVEAPFLEPVLQTIQMDNYESLQYFQRVLRHRGIIKELEKMGIQEGQTVDIAGLQFDFVY